MAAPWPLWRTQWAGAAPVPKGALRHLQQHMEFLRPADGPRIFCTASPKKMGYHLSVIQVELTNVSGETVATGTFTFFMSHS